MTSADEYAYFYYCGLDIYDVVGFPEVVGPFGIL